MRRFNRLRIDAGYSIADVARLMQVNERVACGWLSGKAEPRPDQRHKLARILHVSPEALDDVPESEHRRGDKLRGRISGTYSRIRKDRPADRRNASA